MPLFHHKQPISAQGATYANSFTQTMKGQSLDVWDMFTRESLQNSWDARDTTYDDDGVSFEISYHDLNHQQADLLVDEVFGPETPGLGKLEAALASRKLSLLKVSDSGTNGLRGPTTASSSSDGAEDFVSFVRNIGRSNTKELSGGTYGFGKGVFFIISDVSTVLVYTRTEDEKGEPAHRFIAMANGDAFDIDNDPYTGRHWWGIREIQESNSNRIEYAEPLTGREADRLAELLGMSSHFTAERPTGTCVAVLNPNFQNSAEEHLQEIAKSLTRWAWPHMIPIESGMDPIDFSVSVNGHEIAIPNPYDDPAIRMFVDMYEEALEIPSNAPKNQWIVNFRNRIAQVWSQRPERKLGNLAVINLRNPIPETDTLLNTEITSHIATMRNPRMVVEYYKGPVPLSGMNYCGVFIADTTADEVFARSEPAAHHEWNYQTAGHDPDVIRRFWGINTTTKSNPIRIFFNKLKELLGNDGVSANTQSDTKNFASLKRLSSKLGGSIASAKGGTDRRIPKEKPSRSTPRKLPTSGKNPRATTRLSRLQKFDDEVHAHFECEIYIPPTLSPQWIIPTPFFASDRGKIKLEDIKDAGLEAPRFLHWNENTADTGARSFAPGTHQVTAVFVQPSHSAMGIDIDFLPVEKQAEGDC